MNNILNNLELQLFLEEYKLVLREQESMLKISVVNNSVLEIRNNSSKLSIDCNDEHPKYSGQLEYRINNDTNDYDYSKSFIEFGFPRSLIGLCKYFDLHCRIEIAPENTYYLYIGGPQLDGLNLLPASSLDNYFKDIDLFMSDINARRSSIISNIDKLEWYVQTLYYIQSVGKSKLGSKIKPYSFTIYGMQLDDRVMSRLHSCTGDNIYIADYITIEDCDFSSDDVYNDFKSMFSGANVIKK